MIYVHQENKSFIGLDTNKPVFGVTDQVLLTPACKDTETSKIDEI